MLRSQVWIPARDYNIDCPKLGTISRYSTSRMLGEIFFFNVDSSSGPSLFRPSKIYISHFSITQINISWQYCSWRCPLEVGDSNFFFLHSYTTFLHLHTRNETIEFKRVQFSSFLFSASFRTRKEIKMPRPRFEPPSSRSNTNALDHRATVPCCWVKCFAYNGKKREDGIIKI